MNKSDTRITTIIGKGTVISGDFQAEGSVRMDGTVDGDVKVGGSIVLGATGKVNGSVDAASAMIGGEVIGDVNAPDKIELTATARVIGNLKTNVIVIDEKAIFQGACNMNQEVEEGVKPRKRPVRENRAGRKSAKDALKAALQEVEAEARAQETEAQAASAQPAQEQQDQTLV